MSSANDPEPSPAAALQTAASENVRAGATALGPIALAIVFFGLLAAHVAVNVDPQVLYQADEALTADKTIPIFPTYLRGGESFTPYLLAPGGVIESVGANLSQYFSVPVGGVAVLGVVALVAFVATGSVMSLLGGKGGSLLRYVPPILLVVIWNRYTFVVADQLALLLALLVVGLYFRLPDRSALRAAVALPAILVFYYVAGGLCLFAAAMCGLYELLAKRRRIAWAYLLVGGTAPLIVGRLMGETLSRPHLRLTGLSGDIVATVACAAIYGFFLILTASLAVRSRRETSQAHAEPKLTRRAGAAVAMLVIALVVSLATLDRDVRTFRRLCRFSQEHRWYDVILQATRLVTDSPAEMYHGGTCRRVNRALFEQRILGARMFAYPQAPNGGLLSGPGMAEPCKSDTLLQLGAVDLAESRALESQRRWPNRPYTLRLLIKIAIVRGDLAAARGHLATLSRDIAHGQFAREMLSKIDGGYDFAQDEEIARIRSFMILGRPAGPVSMRGMLEALADRGPDNRMAFEYLMAQYLLNLQLEPMVARVRQVGRFDYEYLPSHYAEAILLHAILTGRQADYDGLPEKDASILISGPMFVRIYEQHKTDPRALQAALAREMGGSYFAYYFTAILRGPEPLRQAAGR